MKRIWFVAVLLLAATAAFAALPQVKTEANVSNPVAPASKAAMWDSLSMFTAGGTVRCAAVGDGDDDTDTLETFIGMSASPRDLRMITPLSATTFRSDLITNTPANCGVQCVTVGNADSIPGNEVVFGTQQAAASYRSKIGMSKWNGASWTTTYLDSSWLSTAANGQQVHSVKVGDVNGDGLNEIVYAMGDTLKMLRYNAATGLFDKSIVLSYGVGAGAHIYGMDIGDFDPDHAGIEIAICTNYGYVVEVYWNGTGWSTSDMYIPGAQGYNFLAIGDFDPDHAGNEVAFSRFNAPTTEIYEIYGGSAGAWTTTKIYTSAAGAQSNGIAIGDYDATHAGNELAYAQYGTKQVIQLKKIGGLWYDEVAFTGGAEMTDWWGLGGGNANPYHAGDELVACNSAPTTRRALRIQDRVVTTDWAMNLVSNDGPFATRYNSVYIQARMLNNSTSPNKAVFLNRVLRPDASIQANTIDSSAAAVNPGEFYAYGYSIFADTIGKWAVAESMAVAGDSLAANDRKLNYFRSADLFTYPVNEGFETALLSGPNWDTTIVVNAGTTAPAWTRIAGSGANPTTAPHGGTAMAQFNSYNASSGNQARLVLWPAEIASAGYSFSFWMNHYTSGGDSMLVDISTDRGATWTKIAGYPLLGTAGWSQKTVSLNAYAGDTVVIALRGRSAYGYNIYIDDVAITSPPAHDFAAGTILAPGSSLINNTQFTPSAWFRNNGSTSENAYVYAEIKDGSGATLYKDSVDQAIAQFDSAMVGFAPFTPTVEGLDTMIYYSALAGDEVAANDRAARTFLVVPVLPLAVDESFENATFPPAYWDTLRYASGATVAGLWSRVTAGTNPACSPFTGAAMAQFNSFNAQAGNQIMLLSPYIATNDANQVNVSFAFYGDPGYATTYDSMIVDVTSDNGATWTRNVAGWWRYQAVAGWRTVTANLGGFGNDTIRVALRAKSAYGNNMFVDSVRIFDAPPQITYTSPADAATDVLVNVPVVAAFSEPIDPATLQFTFSDGATLWTDTTWNAAGDTVTLGHSPWNASNVYTFTVTAASDLNGNALVAGAVPNPFSFTTNADGTPPTAVVVSPAFGATDVALNTPVVVAFSEPMNTGSIDGYSTPTDPWSISFNAAGDTMTLTTATPLDYNSLYHVIGTAGTDLAGYNLVPLPCTLAQFTTIANQGPAITMVQMPVDTYDGTGPFTVKAVITDPAKAGISFTYMYYNTGGAWIQVPSVTLPADSFSYEIPGSTPPGTVISYYVYAQDDAGDGTYSPANAPVGTYQFRILDPLPPTALVAQGLDMSVDLDWAPPAEELVYDTDNYPYWWPGFPAGDMLSTRFTPKHYPCRLEAATSLWYNNIGMDSLIVHIYADDGTGMPDEATELVAPFRIMPQAYPSFTVVDLSSYNIVLASGDFHVGYELVTTGMPVPFFDYQAAGVRSLYRASGVWYGDLGVNNIFRTTVSYSSYTKGLALKSGSLRKGQKPNYAPHNAQAPKLEAAGAKQAAVYPTLTGALAMAKNINGYTVFRGDAPGGPYTSIGSAGTPVFLDNAVQNGTPYYYVVRASYTTPDTFSGYSNEATATPAALPILVVDDDGSSGGAAYIDVRAAYTAALDAAGQTGNYTVYNAVANGENPAAAWYSGRTHVIWFTGEAWNGAYDTTLTPANEAALAAYLDGGGRLFLSAQDYLWDRYPSAGAFTAGQFPYDYLGLASVSQDVIQMTNFNIGGVALSLADGQAFVVNGTVPLNAFVDDLTRRTEAMDVFDVTAKVGEKPAVQYSNGTFRSVFFAFPFENITDGASPNTKGELMYRILNWLTTGVEANPAADLSKPVSYSLAANYPNPVQERTTVKYALPRAGNVRIAVYNVAGQKIKTLVDGAMNAGYHSVSWNGRNESGQAVSAGVYLYKMQADNFSTARKLVVVR